MMSRKNKKKNNNNNDDKSRQSRTFRRHLKDDVLRAGIKDGTLFAGELFIVLWIGLIFLVMLDIEFVKLFSCISQENNLMQGLATEHTLKFKIGNLEIVVSKGLIGQLGMEVRWNIGSSSVRVVRGVVPVLWVLSSRGANRKLEHKSKDNEGHHYKRPNTKH